MQPSFLFGVVYKKIPVLNLNAGYVAGSRVGFHLATSETEMSTGFLFRSPFFVSVFLSISSFYGFP